MAWRIQDSVQRGELDNRQKGTVRGRIWLAGQSEPLVLELRGNACPDLAGCLLQFVNPGEAFPLPRHRRLQPLQRGRIGDLTASRRVRVPDVPVEEFYQLRKEGQSAPEHTANCLYLEWYSESDGRVVIESADYELTISPPAWRLTAEEENRRQWESAAGFRQFLGRLNEAVEAAQHRPPEDKEWDEFDYEKLLRESDARTDKYMELLDRYGDDPDRDHIIAREMGWAWRNEEEPEEESGDTPDFPGAEDAAEVEADGRPEDEPDSPVAEEIEDDSREPDPATEGVDWVREKDGRVSHPLTLRASNGSMALFHRCKELGLGHSSDEDLSDLLSGYQLVGAKLAGALNTLAYGREHTPGAFVVACLKRALGHLHETLATLERVSAKNLLPSTLLATTRTELFDLRSEILQLMESFRKRD